jgi:transposase
MYIRKVKTRTVNNQSYYAIRLVESMRTSSGKVSQKVLLNLGSNYTTIAEPQWPLLTQCLESKLSGITPLVGYDDQIEYEAQRIAQLLIKKHGEDLPLKGELNKHYHEVDVDSVENSNIKSIGAEYLAHEMFKRLGLNDILANCGFNQKQLHLASAAIIGRLLCPGSDVGTCHYVREQSALDEVMGVDFSSLHKNQLYGVSDLLLKHKDEIEKQLFEHEKNTFEFEEIVTLFDLTNTYFEGQSQENELAAFGRSKEKRSDCMLVSLALVLDASGFPKRSQLYQGNVSEPVTLEVMIKNTSKDAIIVMDAGIATEDNVAWLSEQGFKYLVVSRKRNQDIPKDVEEVIVKQEENKTVKSYLVKTEGDKETELYCHSEAMQAHGEKLQDKAKQQLLDALQKLKNGLSKKGSIKKYARVCEKIGRLKEKYSKVANQYAIELATDEARENVIDITWQKQSEPQGKAAGMYCIRTNQTTLDHQQIWQTYRMINDVEAAFRHLKTDLGLRPVYHQHTDRVTGHIFISLLAYHILHSIRFQLKAHEIDDSWSSIKRALSSHYRVTTSMQCKTGEMLHIRKTMRANPQQLKIYQSCRLSSPAINSISKKY